MGIGDNVRGAAENALRDLAGLSEPNDDAHVPEPGDPHDEIQVHSSISEGSNAGEAGAEAVADGADRTDGSVEGRGHGSAGTRVPSEGGDGSEASGGEAAAGEENVSRPARGIPGSGGLPEPDPDGLRADPSEGDGDPSASMGRG